MPIIEYIADNKIIAIVRLEDLSEAVALSRALVAGGVNIVEFTLTNAEAPQAIAKVREALGDQLAVGAGSVITPEQVEVVAKHGAQFVISPVMKPDVIQACHACDLPTMPGAYTPTEIQRAWELGAAAVKVFPARSLGSTYIKDVLAPLPHLRLVPTGGISTKNIAEFIGAGAWAVGVGSALCQASVIAERDWQQLSQAAQRLRKAIS